MVGKVFPRNQRDKGVAVYIYTADGQRAETARYTYDLSEHMHQRVKVRTPATLKTALK